MPDANDDFLLAMAPGLAKPQVIEVRIKAPLDGDYELQIGPAEDYDPILYSANGATAEQIRDAMFDQIVSPTYDPFTAWKLVTDRFRVKGSPGDAFPFSLISPNGTASATVVQKQAASGATTAMRQIYLALAIKLIDPVVYRDVTQEAQAWLAAYFCEQALLAQLAAENMSAAQAGGGQGVSSVSLAVASVSFGGTMPTASELAGSSMYGAPLLLLMEARKYGPIWS